MTGLSTAPSVEAVSPTAEDFALFEEFEARTEHHHLSGLGEIHQDLLDQTEDTGSRVLAATDATEEEEEIYYGGE
jgi:hypothetical protein